MQEVKVLAKVKRHHNDTYGKNVLHEEEAHTDTDRLSVGSDGAHRGDGRTIIVTDIRINRCTQRHKDYEAQG